MLKNEEKDTWETLRGSFILEYSPKGPKWSPINQLNQVKQGKDSLHNYIARIKHLNARCEPHERLSDEQLLPRFLLGLRSSKLHDQLIVFIGSGGVATKVYIVLPLLSSQRMLLSIRARFRDQGVGNGMAGFLYHCATEDLKILKFDE